ncbi:hypothetical protein IMG5_149340 [Ichthyophthirius multifiliis]|uniref:non-specific serine/threonine protein kinase n=1 Tax=Ichthyophthirius multifiliis TaxID=5932 RepID=G0QYG4_ICHMU|nr:hypothetical protein IMG5_149340 [Ichthyophthirius multifiliis]EGR29750.1 hypothetical protein IMG5_149340 [Ichthyophthirius multifiliis]|eukprot:XP_004030986.1 hypothetical protein IMG5_149340 [Ichthyophthirius multifiliis]
MYQQIKQIQQRTNNKLSINKLKQSCQQQFQVSPDIFIHLRVGSISEHYKVGKILGEDDFGQVYKVTHKTTDKVMTMETLKRQSLIKQEEEQLFSEIKILKNLDHTNILKLIELFQDNKNYYVITEFCSGGDLLAKIIYFKIYTQKMAADFIKQIHSFLVYCHANNILHRDFKPENLLFDNDFRNANLKVTYFANSIILDISKQINYVFLSNLYFIYILKFLIIKRKNYDEKCDIWSCGIILYVILCGYPPFNVRNKEEILIKVKAGKLKFDQQDWDKISNDAKNLIIKMLNYDPKKRISAQLALIDQWVQKNAQSIPINQRCFKIQICFIEVQKQNRLLIYLLLVRQLIRKKMKNYKYRLSHQIQMGMEC